MELIFGSNATWMSEFLSENSVWDTCCLCYDKLTYKLAKLYTFFTTKSRIDLVWPKMRNSFIFQKAFRQYHILPWKTMFHSRDSPRLLVCDTGLYLEENDIGFITVAICGGYISKYPRLYASITNKGSGMCFVGSKYQLYDEYIWFIHQYC